MRRSLGVDKRQAELFIILALIAIMLPAVRPRANTSGAPSPTKILPLDVTFRWSDRGGCFNRDDFYFELEGGEWKALLDGFPSLTEQLIERPAPNDRPLPVSGAYWAQGQLSHAEQTTCVRGLMDSGVWAVRSTGYGTGPYQSLYFRLGKRTHKTAFYQSYPSEHPHDPETRLNDYVRSHLPGRVADKLIARWNAREKPAGPCYFPPNWPASGLPR